jgi:hypothetical protein
MTVSNNQKGSGIFKKSKPDFIKLLKKARESENEYISTYQKHVKASIKHSNVIKKHTANLAALDSIMPDGFSSFLPVFNKYSGPEIRTSKKPDTSSPLLLRNYSVEAIEDKDDLVRDHLWHQCWYALRTKFAPQDAVLVTKLNIADMTKASFTMAITGVVFGKDNRRSIPHVDYSADMSLIRKGLAEIIANIKRDVMEQVVQENVITKPEIDNITPLTPGMGTPKQKDRAPPATDIYGVRRHMDKPPVQRAEPKFGDNRPKFGEDRPKFGEDRPKFGEDKPKFGEDKPKFGEGKPDYLQKANREPVAPPEPGFMKPSQKPLGDFGRDQPFRPPQGRGSNNRAPRRSARRSGRKSGRSGHQKNRDHGRNREHGRGKEQGGHPKVNRPDFKQRNRSRRKSNRFQQKRSKRSRRSGRPAGPPTPF